MKYTLAGAYDSNIALLLTVGDTRLETYQQMAETIRQTRMRGLDLATNLEFHYGLVNWFIGQNINARPTTRFIVPYLTAVGEIKQHANNLDLASAYTLLGHAALGDVDGEAHKALAETLQRKESLLLRPLSMLLDEPHMLSGWLSVNRDCYTVIEGKICWNENPLELLADTYHFLYMDYVQSDKPPAAAMIWDHDNVILQDALAFYDQLNNRVNAQDWLELCTLLDSDDAPEGIDAGMWGQVRSAHRGFQAGADIVAILPSIAEATRFYDLTVNSDLTIHIPERLNDEALQELMSKVLVPPPVAKSDEILSESGGMFYARETPEHEVYVKEGGHFDAGDPLFIVEVMKMFNKVYAPFAGTIEQVLVDGDGVIISKGQALYKITPDEPYPLRVPTGKGNLLLTKINTLPVTSRPQPAYVYHRVRPGESLSVIARRYHTSVSKIMRANNIRRSHFIRAGKKLKIPVKGTVVTRTPAKAPARVAGPVPSRHVVKSGDSLWIIAKRYGTTTREIQQLNGLHGPNLSIGQTLKIPRKSSQPVSKTGLKTYRVKTGDSPFRIAQQHDMDLKHFLKINQLTPRTRIFPGQTLYVE